jgi:hypothetical protein
MRVRRGLLFWGLFLIPLGGLPLLVRAGVIDADRLVDAWRLWPLLIIGVGLAILVGRTRAAVVGTLVVALVLGTLGGAALASGNLWFGALSDCGFGRIDQHLEKSGSFDGPATVRLDLRCGSLDLGPGPAAGWTLSAGFAGPAPEIDAATDRLDVRIPGGSGDRRQEWTVRLLPGNVHDLDLTANAASAVVDLTGMKLDGIDAEMNAGDLRIDAANATVARLHATMNAGRIRLIVGSTAMTGDLSVNAGAIDVCVPDAVGLRFDVTDQLTFVTNLGARGLSRSGTVWTRAGTGGAPTVDIAVEGNAASFTLNPDGGCR